MWSKHKHTPLHLDHLLVLIHSSRLLHSMRVPFHFSGVAYLRRHLPVVHDTGRDVCVICRLPLTFIEMRPVPLDPEAFSGQHLMRALTQYASYLTSSLGLRTLKVETSRKVFGRVMRAKKGQPDRYVLMRAVSWYLWRAQCVLVQCALLI